MNRHVSLLLFGAVVLAAVLVGGWLRMNYAPEWWPQPTPQGLRPFPVEADCYSQLARVQRILHGGALIQNHFTVENWPVGLTPSTTAPFDYAILALRAPLLPFTHYPLDWAGALISPVLWIALVLFWVFFRSRAFNRVSRAVLIVGMAWVPVLVWSTIFGRPRHQSLILCLLAVALTAEYERWEKDANRGWHVGAGILWGLLCWTSLYEPLFVVVLLAVFNFAVRRREAATFGISFGVVMLLALAIEGVHVFIPPPEVRPVLERWLRFIAEMRGMSLHDLFDSMAFSALPQISWWDAGSLVFLLILPWIVFRLWQRQNLTDRFVMALTVLLALCAWYERRWLPYASLAELFVVARYFQVERWIGLRALLAAVCVANVFASNRFQISIARLLPPNQPSLEMAELSHAIDAPGGILAPWWISPGLLYFSGQPIVSGSSHCGISGIATSALFYAIKSWPDADTILKVRKVRWVVVWDDSFYQYPLLSQCQQILGLPVSTDQNPGGAASTVAQILINDRDVPDNLRLRAVTPHLKLYEVVGSGGGS